MRSGVPPGSPQDVGRRYSAAARAQGDGMTLAQLSATEAAGETVADYLLSDDEDDTLPPGHGFFGGPAAGGGDDDVMSGDFDSDEVRNDQSHEPDQVLQVLLLLLVSLAGELAQGAACGHTSGHTCTPLLGLNEVPCAKGAMGGLCSNTVRSGAYARPIL